MSWVCPMCSTSNEDSWTNCMVCDALKPDKPEEESFLGLASEEELRSMNAKLLYEAAMGAYSRNPAVAASNLKRSAEDGYAPAQNELGRCYYTGKGVEKNYTEAFRWFSRAAEQGNDAAEYNLGCCYYYGKGVEQNYNYAYSWLQKAA